LTNPSRLANKVYFNHSEWHLYQNYLYKEAELADQWEMCEVTGDNVINFYSPVEPRFKKVKFNDFLNLKTWVDTDYVLGYLLNDGWEPYGARRDFNYLFRRKFQG
jgi:hypothetical protein